jgi:hypothetical protein
MHKRRKFHEGHNTVGEWQGNGMVFVNRPLMWPNNRMFVDSNLAWPKTLGMNQQPVRLMEQFERTSCSGICIYVSFARHSERGAALFLFVFTYLRCLANTCSSQERRVPLCKSTAKCAVCRTGNKISE